MSFPAYPDYKDSGVTWLGAVPSHWTVSALKRRLNIVGGSTPKSDVGDYWDGDIPWITPADLSRLTDFYIKDALRCITADGLASCGATIVPIGSVILSTRAPIGSLGIAAVDLCTNQGCKALVPSGVDGKFLAYLLSVCSTELNVRGRGSTFLELSADELGAFRVTFPTISEQATIAAFLDRETAKIDALVAEQERLIGLLKEKRQAVISHAVTKGLNPNAPMKDSGIEWLGQIPAHWETLPLKAVSIGEGTVFIDGDWIESKDISEDGIRYITTGNVGEGFYKEQGSGFITDETFVALNCTEVLPGDVLISRLNLPIGRACVVPDLGTRIVTSVDNVIVRAGDHVSRKFLTFLLSAKSFFAHTETLARGTTMQRISRTVLGNIRICLPAIDEQLEIAESLQKQTGGIDALVVQAQSAITLLQERRAALISAAVTGKIDVRGLAETSPELERA